MNRKLKFGNIDIDNAVLLAPMEGVTDLPFRLICKKMGADIVYTEFIASEAIVRNVIKTLNKMHVHEEERPVGVQIYGSRIDAMVESAKVAEDSGADFVDINFGCWVKGVVNNNAGAAFLKDTPRMAEMSAAVAKAISVPLTVKTRLGWDSKSFVIVETAKMLEDAGVAALSIHCRTREQAYKGEADWSWIPKVKEVVKMPVILNGDVKTPMDVMKAFEETGCDAVMIGRAAVGNLFLFRQIKEYMATGNQLEMPPVKERIDLCLEHLKLSIEYKGFPRGLFELRKYYSGYLKGLYNSSEIRQKLVVTLTYDEIEDTLMNYKEFLANRDEKVISPDETSNDIDE
jgi:tRNA-dihydrouridine synthase B